VDGENHNKVFGSFCHVLVNVYHYTIISTVYLSSIYWR